MLMGIAFWTEPDEESYEQEDGAPYQISKAMMVCMNLPEQENRLSSSMRGMTYFLLKC